jgi:hypothetical protein
VQITEEFIRVEKRGIDAIRISPTKGYHAGLFALLLKSMIHDSSTLTFWSFCGRFETLDMAESADSILERFADRAGVRSTIASPPFPRSAN